MIIGHYFGRLAQLVRASRLHREGRGFESPGVHHENAFIWSILNLRHRKLFQRTKKYASKALLDVRPNLPQINAFSSFDLSSSPPNEVRRSEWPTRRKRTTKVVAKGCRANEHGPLAQLVERLAGSQKVIGSIPIRSTIDEGVLTGFFFVSAFFDTLMAL